MNVHGITSDGRWNYSNYGACVDIFAPGYQITSAWHTSNNASAVLNGTSMAAPHVTGVIAKHLANNPSLSSEGVTEDLLCSATQNKVTNMGNGSTNRLLYDDLTSVISNCYHSSSRFVAHAWGGEPWT